MPDADAQATLLAWRLAAGARQSVLATHLAQAGGLYHSSDSLPPTPAPSLSHIHLAQRQMNALLRLGIAMVPIWHLPAFLRRVPRPPVALFVRGAAQLIHKRPAVAIIGSRQASPAGAEWAHMMGEHQAGLGHLVLSGGALGIDTAAHLGTLKTATPTLAYMGTAIDRPYPSSNRELFAAMLERGGALVSEHPPLSMTYKASHALRNRFIVAHAERLIVVEAALASGTLSAVNFARRLGTPVSVAPRLPGAQTEGLADLLTKGWAQPYHAPVSFAPG
jgi:DNA protecting protein DprA